jgi:hypothetical protein
MKKLLVVLLAVVMVLSLTVAPSEAWRGHGWHGGCCWGGWWWPGALFGGLALGAAVAATYPPYYYAAPPVVYESAPVYATPPAPAPPAVQREVVYPNGKYLLYGDGVQQPWQWVWIPAAPPPPASPQR